MGRVLDVGVEVIVVKVPVLVGADGFAAAGAGNELATLDAGRPLPTTTMVLGAIAF